MANRDYRSSAVYSMEAAVKQIFAKVTFGSTGAPTLSAKDSKGVNKITRVSAGLYDIVMGTPVSAQAATSDNYFKLLMVKHVFTNATTPAAPGMYIVSSTVNTNGTIRILFNSAGTATDPASGEIVNLHFIFSDSNV